ncbi:hypothetical protein [Ornithinimicrobium sp. INDO-MA30-4]|uniref:hypothetical protein n=1 Tax=Ornithinimicrobium sp. INDO-MA30-4 TaxID=2908651 RepID=UPI001F31C5C5|nr:hypothetical protein [Ornithinimicrobium sp. INDO-MA30-4]UJH70220.1 hypothetical protein L0A91_13775 [Ornithinimicrobium sp. INDO-MA30-4]
MTTPVNEPGSTGSGPRPVIPPAILARYGARVLEPTTAARTKSGPLQPTAYIGSVLLVFGVNGGTGQK